MIQIKAETKMMNVSFIQFDRLLHQDKLFFNQVSEQWQFITSQEFKNLMT